ncbi:hypothetical protein OAR97_01150 [Arcobacteraceae bacterium]|nr:hypothetical protein [Arcobacteraceae bacterium]
MSLEYRTGFCSDCDADRKLERKKPNHILHFLITVVLGIFTYGIGSVVWMGVWFLIAVKFNSWTCATCGNKNAKPVFNTTEDVPKNTESVLINKLKQSYKLIIAFIVSVFVIIFLFSLFSDDSTSGKDKKEKVEEKKKVVNATVDIKDKTSNKKDTLALKSVDSDLCYIYDTIREKDLLRGSVSCKEGELTIRFYDSDTNREVVTQTVTFKDNKFSIKVEGLENNDFESEIKLNEKQIKERLKSIKEEKPRTISSIKSDAIEIEECMVENWKYAKDSDEYLLIEGTTSCDKGQIILNIYEKNNGSLGKESAYINDGIFKVYLQNSSNPQSLSIDYEIIK